MKAQIIYEVIPLSKFQVFVAEIARSGKWIQLDQWKPRIDSIPWGSATPELVEKAKALNKEIERLNALRKAFLAELKATRPGILAAASKVPETPKGEPEAPIRLTPDML